MKSIENEAIRFYLKNYSTIREWADIENDLNRESILFLESLGDDIKVAANSLDANCYIQFADNYPYYSLAKPHWFLKSDENLVVAIGLHWEKKVNFMDEYKRPYVGLWANRNTPQGNQLSPIIRSNLASIITEHNLRQEEDWPVWKLVKPPNEEFWKDLTPYRDLLIKSISNMWILLHEEIDNILQSNLPQPK